MPQRKVPDWGSFSHSPSRSSKDKWKQKKGSPDLYSVPPDPPRWGLLWIALLLLLRNQSQWGMCWHSAPRATEGLFNSMRSGITIQRRKLHSENWSAHDSNAVHPNSRRVNSATHLLTIKHGLSEILHFLWSLLLFPLSQSHFANLIA